MFDFQLIDIKSIDSSGGTIEKVINAKSDYFKGFGELYLTSPVPGKYRDWRMHKSMVCSVYPVIGSFEFILEIESKKKVINLNSLETKLLQINKGVWFTFKGLEQQNALMNFASETYSEDEIDRKPFTI